MNKDLHQKIYVAGHRGMVGSAIVRHLEAMGYTNIITRTHSELDLTNQVAVQSFFRLERPEQVYLAAAKVGGIHANNTFPAEFIYQNLMMEANVIHQAFIHGVKKLLFLGSSCIYPQLALQPISEDSLLSGKLEPTNEPYAIAKIAGIKLCDSYNRQFGKTHGIDYRSVMPTNLYGPGDNYHPENSHVIPALIGRFNAAKNSNAAKIEVWGTGNPRREFLYSEDLASACVLLMGQSQVTSLINVGYGSDISIKELAQIIKETIGFKGELVFDVSKPDGTPQKLLDSSKVMSLGWLPKVGLREGIQKTYFDYQKQIIN